jgi:hypothetical protein
MPEFVDHAVAHELDTRTRVRGPYAAPLARRHSMRISAVHRSGRRRVQPDDRSKVRNPRVRIPILSVMYTKAMRFCRDLVDAPLLMLVCSARSLKSGADHMRRD